MKTPKPWKRGDRGWYVQIDARQIFLSKDEKEAWQIYHRLMTSEGLAEADNDIDLGSLIDSYLDYTKRHNKRATYNLYRWALQNLFDRMGRRKVSTLKPIAIETWIASNESWDQSSRHHIISISKRLMRWGVKQGLITKNPLQHMSNPYRIKSRDRVVSEAEFKAMLDATPDQQFRDFMTVCLYTGARPGEIASVEARHVNLKERTIILQTHKADRHGEPRVILIPTILIDLIERLIGEHPRGFLFRNTVGNPWTGPTIGRRIDKLRSKLGLDKKVVFYSFRHSFCSTALENGVDIYTTAKLMGHTTVRQVERHYAHVRRDHLRAAADRAIGGAADKTGGTTIPEDA
jgi:integrase